jgi:hypothetical protein
MQFDRRLIVVKDVCAGALEGKLRAGVEAEVTAGGKAEVTVVVWRGIVLVNC